jgi:hypothetical protein
MQKTLKFHRSASAALDRSSQRHKSLIFLNIPNQRRERFYLAFPF